MSVVWGAYIAGGGGMYLRRARRRERAKKEKETRIEDDKSKKNSIMRIITILIHMYIDYYILEYLEFQFY